MRPVPRPSRDYWISSDSIEWYTCPTHSGNGFRGYQPRKPDAMRIVSLSAGRPTRPPCSSEPIVTPTLGGTMKIVLSLSGDGCADYSDDLANLGEQVFKEKSLYSCSFYPIGAGSVLDRYRGGHAAIKLQVRARTRSGDPCDFRAVYQINVRTLNEMTSKLQQGAGDGPSELGRPLQHDFDQPVLVGVIEVAKDGKERRQDGVLSVVRLNLLDSLADRETKGLNVPVTRPEIVGFILDHEGTFARVGRWI